MKFNNSFVCMCVMLSISFLFSLNKIKLSKSLIFIWILETNNCCLKKIAIFISLLPSSDFCHTLFSIWPKEKRIQAGNRERRRERGEHINVLNSLSLSVRNTPIKSILIHTINLLNFNLYYEGIIHWKTGTEINFV